MKLKAPRWLLSFKLNCALREKGKDLKELQFEVSCAWHSNVGQNSGRTDGEMAWTMGKAYVKWLSDDCAMWSPEVGDQTKSADMFVLA